MSKKRSDRLLVGGCGCGEYYQLMTMNDLKKYDGRLVELDGTYAVGFEVSAFNKTIWVDFNKPSEQIVENKPLNRVAYKAYPATIYGRLSSSNSGYGHLGHYKASILADRIVYR